MGSALGVVDGRRLVLLGGVELVDGSYAFDFVEYPVVVVGGAELDVMPYVEVEREVSAEVLGGCLLVVANLHGGERVADLAHVDDVVVEAVGGDDAVGEESVVGSEYVGVGLVYRLGGGKHVHRSDEAAAFGVADGCTGFFRLGVGDVGAESDFREPGAVLVS